MRTLPRLFLSLASVAALSLGAQTASPDPGPYLAQQPDVQIPNRPVKSGSPGDQLVQEERDARFLMDLQIANQVRSAQSSESVRENQEKASAALLEYYTRLLQPQGDQASAMAQNGLAQAAALGQMPAMPQPQGQDPSSAGKRTQAVGAIHAAAGGAQDPSFAEDGPTVARKKGLGYIPKGSIIDIRLYTQVNTSIPGPVVAEVVYDVWDIDQRYILIPRGTKCTGAASQMGSDTDSGGKVVFDTFIDPTGREIPIAIPVITSSRIGVTGIPGKVDYHWGRVLGGSAALAIITAITSGNQPAAANSTMTQSDLIRQNLVSQGGQLSNSFLNRFTQIKPDITLEEGSAAKVIILQHMMVKPYQKVY